MLQELQGISRDVPGKSIKVYPGKKIERDVYPKVHKPAKIAVIRRTDEVEVKMAANDTDGVVSGCDVTLLYLDISDLSSTLQIVLLSSAAWHLFTVGGFIQEILSRLYWEEFYAYNLYLTMIQLGCLSVFGFVELLFKENNSRRVSIKMHAVLAILTATTYGLGNFSLSFISYPHMVLFKSFQLVPLMIGGLILYGKRTDYKEVLSVILLTVGLVNFVLADSKSCPVFHLSGVLAMMVVVCADIAIGSLQQRVIPQCRHNNAEIIFYSCFMSFLCILCIVVLSGTFSPAFIFCREHPMETYGLTAFCSLFGFLGTHALLSLNEAHGTLLAVTVTIFRKATSVILSFVIFSKPFIFQYLWSAMLFFLGYVLNIYTRHRKRIDSAISKYYNNER